MVFGKRRRNGGKARKPVGSAVRCEPHAAWVGVTGANPFSCLKIEAVQKFTVVQIDIYLMCSKPLQTLDRRADNSCLFLLQIIFSAVLSQTFHPWGSGQAPKINKSADLSTLLCTVLLLDQQMRMRKTVNPFRAVAFGNEFGFDSDQVVRSIVLKRFEL